MLHCIDITSESRGGSANAGSEREVACSGRESKDPTVTEGQGSVVLARGHAGR